ncbi:DUF3596 domain-containing protein [Pseudomonas sp. FH1]|nr:DUF3596 domain-containing protein [Pseudomonas sp. FH1]
MGKVVARKETGNLFFDFRYLGKRCREQTTGTCCRCCGGFRRR